MGAVLFLARLKIQSNRRRKMAATAETASDVVDMLNDLIELNYDTLHAYEAAIDRLDNGEHQHQFTAFKDDQDRQIRELDSVIRKLGGKPANGASVQQVVTVGKVAFADILGDKLVLEPMKSNVDDINKAYKCLATRRDLPPEAVPVIQAALDDERRHHDWFEKTIAAF
jgi:uncharacterized protein (TIGR02284 family)